MNDLAIAWVDALRSGKYKQTTRWLRDDDAFCCLGVACELFRQTHGDGEWVTMPDATARVFVLDNVHITKILPSRVRTALGLRGNDGEYGASSQAKRVSLALNNDRGMSFSEIADIIESEPEGLFLKESASE